MAICNLESDLPVGVAYMHLHHLVGTRTRRTRYMEVGVAANDVARCERICTSVWRAL